TAEVLMTPRNEIVWIDYNEEPKQIYQKMISHEFSRYPVCEGSLDNILGIISMKEFLIQYHSNAIFRMEDILFDPLIISGEIDALSLLDKFRDSRSYVAVIIDDKRSVKGMIALHDLLVHIVGELPDNYETEEDKFFRREDGSYLVDANFRTSEIQKLLPISFSEDSFGTISGLMVSRLGHMPKVGDRIIEQNYLFEIVDMDGIKIDKILVSLYKKTVYI
ncbi:MAG: transporter associated domain-containing protein, partial [Ignavibacteriaceae bacterium]|nr:transporter associated domain-containing protein [Ignavibacteriaceae bacterium]